MQKLIAFDNEKYIDMLKLGCTSSNRASVCLHKSTDTEFYPLTEKNTDLLEKNREEVVGGHLMFLHRQQLLMKHLF